MVDVTALLKILSDGEFHAGEELGRQLGITRAAVWKRLQSLADLHIPVESNRAKGYRIPGGLDLLCKEQILAEIPQSVLPLIGNFLCMGEVESTNSLLLTSGMHGDICLAERQTAGRGRRGRSWFSPYGRNVYMTVRWHFDQGVAALEGLSLAVGVLIAEALAGLGMQGVSLKWPNDLLCNGQKLGGILIEVGGDLTGECVVVIGIGLNVSMSETPAGGLSDIGQPWTDLKRQGYSRGRNRLCGAILSQVMPALRRYPEDGFGCYRERWQKRCAFLHQPIQVLLPNGSRDGVLLGVDAQGGLRVLIDGAETVFAGGEISLRSRA